MQHSNVGVSRNVSLDLLKLICAFLVVCIHVVFPGTFGACVKAIARIAVPIFFMISGFFYDNTVRRNRHISQIRRVATLFLVFEILLTTVKIFFLLLSGSSISDYLAEKINFSEILQMLFFNKGVLNGHLWYLLAFLYTLLIVHLFHKSDKMQVLYAMIPFLLMGNLILGNYSVLLLGREFPVAISRNAYFVGIPYFCLGILFSRRKKMDTTKRLSTVLNFGILVFACTTVFEYLLLEHLGLKVTGDHYVSTVFLSCCVFVRFILLEETSANRLVGFFAQIGRDYSTWIYLTHLLVLEFFEVLVPKLGMERLYRPVAPIAVFVCTTIFVVVVKRLLDWMKSKAKK